MPDNHPPNIEWLYDFLTVARTRSFTKAADLRNSSQPSLSRRIKMLENWAGHPLLDRTRNPVELTDAGVLAKNNFEQIVRLSEDTRDAIREGAYSGFEGVVIGFAPELEWIVNDVIHLMKQDDPALSFRASTLEPNAVDDAFRTRQLHFFIQPTEARTEPENGRSRSITIKTDRLIPVTVPDEDGKPTHSLTRREDGEKRYYGFAQATFFGRQVASLIKARPELHDLKKLVCTHLPNVIAESIVKERGVGWLPESFAGRYLRDHTLARAGSSSYDLPVRYSLTRASDHMPGLVEKSWDALVARMHGARG
jgi:LysR family transcriptional regulator, hypochlorite-specific transcription factor HypT